MLGIKSKCLKVLALLALSMVLAISAGASVNFYTCVGGASGMTLQLNPFASGGVIRGCASKMMDITLQQVNNPSGTGTIKSVYTAARMKAPNSIWSEPTGPWGPTQQAFTGDKSQCEIDYIKLSNGNFLYSLVIRADSIIGLRFAVNRQFIYSFAALSSGAATFVDSSGNAASDPDWVNTVGPAVQAQAATSAGIPIEGGLSECYIDSGVRGIDRYNRLFPAPAGDTVQPQINPANYQNTPNNLLAITVLAILYNTSLDSAGLGPLNITNQMERMISSGMADDWDVFFSRQNLHAPMLNFYREPLSGTCVTYLDLIMRGLETNANGTVVTLNSAGQAMPVDSAGYNWHRSGIPDLTCDSSPTESAPNVKPGSGAMLTAVDQNPNAHGYCFLQKFTPVIGTTDTHIRVCTVNGYSP